MADLKVGDEVREICGDWRTAGRRENPAGRFLVLCRRSKGHTASDDPQQREHFDPDHEITWTDDAAAR